MPTEKQIPTDEQQEALRKFQTGKSLKVTAFAGAGKTTTLSLLARSRTTRGSYLAFNKAIAVESKSKFPDTVDCRTTHSLAYQAVMNAHRFSSGQMTEQLKPKQLTELLDLKRRIFGGKFRLDGIHQAFLTLGTIRRFCQSDADAISFGHVPAYGRLAGLPEELADEVKLWALGSATELWKRMINPREAAIPLGFDGFLKLWALGRPKIAVDFIMLDEAQDTNPAVLGVLQDQQAQIVYVGDKHQQIYEWRGAINAMEMIKGCEEAYLTQSFRFGPAIADAASRVLATLGEEKQLLGTSSIRSTIMDAGDVNAVLARTNATVIKEVLEALGIGLRPHIVGGARELKVLIRDVYNLKAGEPAISAELFGFTTWQEVVEFSETEEGEELRMFVQLVEQHGEGRLWWAITNAEANETTANLIVSTAHKAKGREWGRVRLSPDFLSSRITPDDPNAEAEVRLFYVAMTRAKQLLVVDNAMLSTFADGLWLNRSTSLPSDTVAQPGNQVRKAAEKQKPAALPVSENATWELPKEQQAKTGTPKTRRGLVKEAADKKPVANASNSESPQPDQFQRDTIAAQSTVPPPLEIPKLAPPAKKRGFLAIIFGRK